MILLSIWSYGVKIYFEQLCNDLFIDIDECDDTLDLNQCSEPDKCLNTDGGYVCSCSIGSRLENDGRTCARMYSNRSFCYIFHILFVC